MATRLTKLSKLLRYTILTVWLAVIGIAVCRYLWRPSDFTAGNIAGFISSFGSSILVVYMVMSALRGFTLLPSTPLVLAGTLLFADKPWLVFTTSLAGILISSSMIYFFSDHLGFHSYFESHKPDLTHSIKRKLEHPLGFAFVAAWAFFPLVPTDLVCYLAGTTEMNYWKFIAAILTGEAILCSFYVFFGGTLVQHLR